MLPWSSLGGELRKERVENLESISIVVNCVVAENKMLLSI